VFGAVVGAEGFASAAAWKYRDTCRGTSLSRARGAFEGYVALHCRRQHGVTDCILEGAPGGRVKEGSELVTGAPVKP
jgi:hypothetical protein